MFRCRGIPDHPTIQAIAPTGESVEFPEKGIYVMETP
jgi:hypothetical protein